MKNNGSISPKTSITTLSGKIEKQNKRKFFENWLLDKSLKIEIKVNLSSCLPLPSW